MIPEYWKQGKEDQLLKMGKKAVKKPEYPEETKICGLIFIFQLIAVLRF